MQLTARIQRFIFAFLLVASCYLLVANLASAQTYDSNFQSINTYNQVNPYATPNTTSDVPKNLHFYTQNVMIEVMSSMICQLSGIDPTNPNQPCLGVDSKTGKIGFDQKNGGGAIGVMGKYIGDLYALPVHSKDYINYLTSNFGITKTYAATTTTLCDPTKNGIGFCGLSPFTKIWSSFRDVVYLFFVIIFVLVGMAIMFRMKIDPRTVMTVENQIPKIITNIILVTLSFAIAGFLIDMMYVTMYTTNNIIVDSIPTQATTITQQSNVFGAADEVGGTTGQKSCTYLLGNTGGCNNHAGGFFALAGAAGDAIAPSIAKTAIGSIGGEFITGVISTYFFTLLDKKIGFLEKLNKGTSSNWVAQTILGVITVGATVAIDQMSGNNITLQVYKLIVSLILLIALIWALFRLWFALVGAYISILFHVVLAPFMIFFGVIPGSSIGFGSWIRGMISNLLAFPVTIIMFLLGGVFIQIGRDSSASVFAPPLIGGSGTTGSLAGIIGIGVIFMTPQVVKMMQELFKSEGFKYTSAVGQAVGVGQGVLSGTGSAIYSPYGALHNFGRFKEEGGISGLFSAEARAKARAKYNKQTVDLPDPHHSGR